MKKCFKCGLRKRLSEFYAHDQMNDGHLGKCKECSKGDARENYRKRRSYYRAYDRRRQQTKERRLRKLAYGKTYRALHPERKVANYAVNNAVRDGRLEKKPCEVCGSKKSEAHHADYGKPLDVQWLCLKHHREAHARMAA